jgi:hypothetical protein
LLTRQRQTDSGASHETKAGQQKQSIAPRPFAIVVTIDEMDFLGDYEMRIPSG